MIEEQEIINTIRSAVLDMTKRFTAYDLFELPRTGRMLQAIKACYSDLHTPLMRLGCRSFTMDGDVFYLPPGARIEEKDVA